MTTAPPQNRPSRQERQVPRRYDSVPPHLRKYRTAWTVVSLLGSFAGAAWSAVALGMGDQSQINASLFLIVAGLVFAALAHHPGWYNGAGVLPARMRRTRPAQGGTQMPVSPPVQRRPRPRQSDSVKPRAAEARRQPAGPVPDPELGVNFAYIVQLVRRMAEKGAAGDTDIVNRFAMMERTYQSADWRRDLADEDMHPYRHPYRYGVQLVRSIVTEDDRFVPRDHANYDRGDLRNPEVFLEELDLISEAAAAVAALMLTRADPDVTDEVFRNVMSPWIQARLPYRLDHLRYVWKKEDQGYRPFEIEGAAPPIPDVVHPDEIAARPAARPVDPPADAPVDLDDEDQCGYSVNQIVHACEHVVVSQFGSTQMIGRKLRLGFGASGRIVDALVEYGILDPENTDSGRKVLATPEQLAEAKAFVYGKEIERRHG